MCTHCLFLYILHTTDIITLWALPSLFPNSKHFFYFFYFPVSGGKEDGGDRGMGISCSFLCFTKSQEHRPTWSGGEQV